MTLHERMREMLARRSELSAAEESRLREHLMACPECRETADAYSRQTALIRALPAVEPPSALRAGVLSRVREAPPVPLWRRWWERSHAVALLPLAAALLLVAGAFAFLRQTHQVSSPSAASHASATPTSVPARVLPPAARARPTPTAVHGRRHRPRRPGRSRPGPRAQQTAVPASGPPGQVALGPTPPLAYSPPAPRQSAAAPPVSGPVTAPRSGTRSGTRSAPPSSPPATGSGVSRPPVTGGSGHPVPGSGGAPLAPTAAPTPQPSVKSKPTPPSTSGPTGPMAPVQSPSPTQVPSKPPAITPTAGPVIVIAPVQQPTPTPGTKVSVPSPPPPLPSPTP